MGILDQSYYFSLIQNDMYVTNKEKLTIVHSAFRNDTEAKAASDSLNLGQIYSVVLFLAFGLASALIVLVVEIFRARYELHRLRGEIKRREAFY